MARPLSANAELRDLPETLSNAELIKAFEGLSDAGIIRGLIETEIRYIRAGGERSSRTLRGFWYDMIKLALSRTGVLNPHLPSGKQKFWDQLLSKQLEDMVSARQTTYEEMNIFDGSRQKFPAMSMNHTVAEVRWVGPHYPWVILFCEKDTIWPIIESVAQLYGVSAISGGGQPSAAATENILKSIVRSPTFEHHFAGDLHLIGLTDYDPFGYKIFEAQYKQILRFFPADEVDEKVTLKYIRLGVFPDQLSPDALDVKAYNPSPEGLKEWFASTGGVNGKPLGIELDALPVVQIREMFARAIEERINLDPRRDDLREGFIEEMAWKQLMPEIEVRKAKLIKAVKDSIVWSKIHQTEIPAYFFRDAAIDGESSIDPRDVFKEYADAVHKIMKKAV